MSQKRDEMLDYDTLKQMDSIQAKKPSAYESAARPGQAKIKSGLHEMGRDLANESRKGGRTQIEPTM